MEFPKNPTKRQRRNQQQVSSVIQGMQLERTEVAQQDFERRLPGFDWETLQDKSDDGLSNYSRMIGHAVMDGEITSEEGHAAINLY